MNARAHPPRHTGLTLNGAQKAPAGFLPSSCHSFLPSYLRFLRPLRSLFVISIVTFSSRGLFEVLWHYDSAHATVLALIFFLSFPLGDVIAGTVHEPMHRPFILLLPGGLRQLRRATVVAIIVAALAVTCVVSLTDAGIPRFAIFGLVIGLIALPCINRHRGMRSRERYVSALCRGTILGIAACGTLPSALSAAPWAFLVGGSAIATASVAWGFSRRHLRERSTTPFVSLQTLVCSYAFQSAMSAGRSEELSGKNVFHSSAWKIRAVGSSTFAWMQVVWHALSGSSKSNSLLKIPLFFFGLSVLGGAGLAAVVSSLNFFTNHPGATDYWEILACFAVSKTDAQAMGLPYHLPGDLSQIVITFQLVLSLGILRRAMKPPVALPISRARMARVTFGLNAIQMLIALATPTAAIFSLSLIGQIVSGQLLPAFGLLNLMPTTLLLAIVSPLVALTPTFRRRIASSFWILTVWILIFGVSGAHSAWGPHVLTWPGLLIASLLIAANVGLLRHRLTRHFATCDLTFERTVFTR